MIKCLLSDMGEQDSKITAVPLLHLLRFWLLLPRHSTVAFTQSVITGSTELLQTRCYLPSTPNVMGRGGKNNGRQDLKCTPSPHDEGLCISLENAILKALPKMAKAAKSKALKAAA